MTAARRLGGAFAAIPTWKEQGVDAAFSTWRGVSGPKDMSQAQFAYWENILAKLVQTEEWKKDMANNFWESNFMDSADSRKFLRGQYDEYKAVLTDLGLARQP